MEKLQVINIEARDIPDAWFQLIYKLLEVGFDYTIEQGSFVGDKRLEFDSITVHITYPQTRPFEPKIPTQYNMPDPVLPGYIEEYLPYLMTAERKPNEAYTYGSRLFWQFKHFIKLLKETPNTNQAILQVARPEDRRLSDPPCLRHIDMRIKDGRLIFYIYFRSWDLWSGFPANLGAIVYLQELLASEIGVKPGPFVCYSKGLHIYSYVWELAEILRGKTLKEFKEGI